MSLTRKFEMLFTAVTFAEAGEFETAREIMADNSQQSIVNSHKSKTNISTLNPKNPELTTDAA